MAPAETGQARQPVEYRDFEPEVLYGLLAAEIAAQRGRYDVTLVNYVSAARQTRDTGVIERAMRIAQSLNSDEAQQQLADLWLEVDPQSIPAHRVKSILAVRNNNLEEAMTHMEKVMNLGGDADFDSLAVVAGQLPPEQQQKLLQLYQKLAEKHPGTPEIEYGIALLLKVTGTPKLALERLQPLIDENPAFQPAILLKGDLLYQTGQHKEALNYLMRNTRRFPDNRKLGTLYGRMLISAGEMQAAQDEFARLAKRFPDVPGLHLSHALVALENGDAGLARERLSQLIEQGHHVSEAHYYLGRIEEEAGNPELAIGYYDKVTEGKHYFPALARTSALRAAQGNLEDALANLQTLRNNNPEIAENLWLLEINLLLDQERNEAALKAVTKALQAHPDNIRMRYARAMLYDRMGAAGKAEADLRQLLEQDPDNAAALNALGYILISQSGRLDEAQSLIERALTLDPENGAILDSMGWVLYQQGNTEAALDYLTRAWNAMPDPEVAAHLGEVLWTSGNRDQARIIWEKGQDLDGRHPILQETIERLVGDDAL
ncbi:tetratricopeptide repeat protein [Marinobacter sp.]|uniref:tetratricopeptide repeat protein n=1 Tax=Marinobacter sp. TaxID=50741 RepID=UPI0034262640